MFKLSPKVRLLNILGLIACQLAYCWIILLMTDKIAGWQHVTALLLFIPVVYLFFRNLNKSVLATGLFLLIGIGRGFSLTPDFYSLSIGIGPIRTPDFNTLCLGLFVLYFLLNFEQLANIYLDYQESKRRVK